MIKLIACSRLDRVKEELENVSYDEIINIIKKMTANKDGDLFIDFEEYE